MTGSQRHGWAVWAAMAFLFLAGVTTAYWAEAKGNPLLAGTDQHAGASQSGGNMEGKEVRLGIANSALFTTVTTDASCGAVNSMHDSYTPLGGMVPLVNIMLGEVVFGGVGAGLYGIFVFVVLAVFIAGLMVGRTPEYLGKKIESYDVKMAMLAVLILTFTILTFSAISVVKPYGTSSISNPGPHGLSQILYAYVSTTGNNGSAFSGLIPITMWYNTTTAVAQLLGRFFMIIPVLAIAGSLAKKGSAQEFVETRILGCFLKNDEFGLGNRHALGLEQQITEILVATAPSKKGFDVAVDGFHHSETYFGAAVIQDSIQVIRQHQGQSLTGW